MSAVPVRRLRPLPTRRAPLRMVARPEPLVSRRRRVGAAALVAAMVAVASLLAMAALHAMLVAGQVRLDELQKEVAEEQSRYAVLRLDVAKLESPRHVVRSAQSFGLTPPPAGAPVYLAPSAATTEALADGAPGPVPEDDDDWAAVKPLLGERS